MVEGIDQGGNAATHRGRKWVDDVSEVDGCGIPGARWRRHGLIREAFGGEDVVPVIVDPLVGCL